MSETDYYQRSLTAKCGCSYVSHEAMDANVLYHYDWCAENKLPNKPKSLLEEKFDTLGQNIHNVSDLKDKIVVANKFLVEVIAAKNNYDINELSDLLSYEEYQELIKTLSGIENIMWQSSSSCTYE